MSSPELHSAPLRQQIVDQLCHESLCFAHHCSCSLRPRHLTFAGVTTHSTSLLCDLIFGCFRWAVCELWGGTGGGAAAPGPAQGPGPPGSSLPHQALRSPDGADRAIAPRLRSDGDRAEGHWLDLHSFTCTFLQINAFLSAARCLDVINPSTYHCEAFRVKTLWGVEASAP